MSLTQADLKHLPIMINNHEGPRLTHGKHTRSLSSTSTYRKDSGNTKRHESLFHHSLDVDESCVTPDSSFDGSEMSQTSAISYGPSSPRTDRNRSLSVVSVGLPSSYPSKRGSLMEHLHDDLEDFDLDPCGDDSNSKTESREMYVHRRSLSACSRSSLGSCNGSSRSHRNTVSGLSIPTDELEPSKPSRKSRRDRNRGLCEREFQEKVLEVLFETESPDDFLR